MSEIQYNTETKRGWRIILIDESGTDILHGYAQDKAEKHAKKIIGRYNAFEDGGIVDELRTALELELVCLSEASVKFERKHHKIGQELLTKAFRIVEAALAKS